MRAALLLATSLATGSILGVPHRAAAEAPFSLAATPGLLPKAVVPSAYRIDLIPDLGHLAFTGHEDIEIDVAAPGDTVMLNQAGLTLSSARLEDGAVAAVSTNEANETATLRFPTTIPAGHHTLTIDYAGPIPGTPSGLYHDDYKTHGGAARRMLVTQFEVADARRMFPGWDEPAFKATFQLSVTLPAGDTPISNMPVLSETPTGNGAKHVVFAATPRMSTYLLALVAGDFASRHATAGRTDVGLFAPAGTESQGEGALAAAAAILPYYDDYFGVPYPLPKLDLIAIPGNYAAGAMENWGAITYIDNALLFDPATSAPRTRELVFEVVAHEMAHQWSGDLVTMGWWDNIWLNEGFATWMADKASDHFHPEWDIWPRQHQEREQAMAQDAQPTTHPIQQVIHDVSEAGSAFDRISYQKGEQVIRMIEDWLGPDAFRDGMRGYMKAHAYGNTTSTDLWAALAEASHRDVAGVATSFTEQPGVPLVQVSRACTDGRTTLTLTQGRFTINDPAAAKLAWQIPVTLGAPGVAGSAPQKLMLVGTATPSFDGCGQPLKANLGEDGYYRTQYDAASLALLRASFATLSATDQADLLGDQFALFRAGRAPLGEYLDLLTALQAAHVTSNAVWDDTIDHVLDVDALLRGDAGRAAFRSFASTLLTPQLTRLGWDAKPGESFLDALLRPELVAALGKMEDPAVTAEAKARFAAFQADSRAVPPALLDPVTRIVGMQADLATWQALRDLGEAAPGTEEKLRYFGAMAAAHDPALMQRNIAFATSGAVPAGRILQFLGMAAMRGDDPDGFLRAALPQLGPVRTALGPTGDDRVMSSISLGASDPALAAAILADPATKASRGATLDAAKAADLIATTAALRGRTAAEAATWLQRGR